MDGYALIDRPRSGVENMALDQRCLEIAAQRQCIVLRVYQWSEPTLSLGYFQPYAQRLSHSPSGQIAVVRRSTGGGAIVHHFEWTYCIAVPDSYSLRVNKQSPSTANNIGASQSLYDCMHDAVVQWLNGLGLIVHKWTQSCMLEASAQAPDSRVTVQKTPFLCFQRRSCGDVVRGTEKVMGSAQRRIPGAVLQHGSLLLASSPYAPSLPGLGMEFPSTTAAASLQNGEQTSFAVEVFFQRLLNAVEMAAHAKLECLESVTDGPLHWNWPTATCFAETSWTERL